MPGRSRRVGRASPSQSPSSSSRSSSSTSPPPPAARARIRAGTTRVSFTTTSVGRQLVGQLGEPPVPHAPGRALVDEQPRLVAPLERVLRDQLGRQLVVELARSIRRRTLRPPRWTRTRSSGRASGSPTRADGRTEPAELEAALERARRADRGARRDRRRARGDAPRARRRRRPRRRCARRPLPLARQVAEVRGLLNQCSAGSSGSRATSLAERHARVDDLALARRPDHVRLAVASTSALARLEQALEAGPRRGRLPARRRGARAERRRLPRRSVARRGQDELEAAAPRRARCRARSGRRARRELARDREPEAGAAAVARPERPEDPLALARRIPGPVSSTATATVPFAARQLEPDPAAVGRPAERVREQVRDDLEHAVAVGDDHRARPRPRGVVDRAPPRLLGERRVRAARRSRSMSTSSWSTVKRCASSFARSSMSPTSRSSRSASAAITSSECVARARDPRRRPRAAPPRARGSPSAASAARARPSSGSSARAPRSRASRAAISPNRSARCADLVAARHARGPRRRTALRDLVGRPREREHRLRDPPRQVPARAAPATTSAAQEREREPLRAASPSARWSSVFGFATTSAPNGGSPLELDRVGDGEVRAVARRAAGTRTSTLASVLERARRPIDARRQLPQAGVLAGERARARRSRAGRRSRARAAAANAARAVPRAPGVCSRVQLREAGRLPPQLGEGLVARVVLEEPDARSGSRRGRRATIPARKSAGSRKRSERNTAARS